MDNIAITHAVRHAARSAISKAGGSPKLAKEINVSRYAVHLWKQSGIPLARVCDVSRVTGIPKRELRPDVFDGDDA